jgi:hypothetical protein
VARPRQPSKATKQRNVRGLVSAEALGGLLGLAPSPMRALLKKAGLREITVRGAPLLRWEDIERSLDPDLVREARAAAKAQGFVFCGSRYTVAGYRHLVREWHPTKNGDLTPWQVSYGSSKRIWWRCGQGADHEWEATVANRTMQGTRCPFCTNKRVSITNALATVQPVIASQWHEEKNGDSTPATVVFTSKQPAWWSCQVAPDHVWAARISDRTVRRKGCPFCAGQRVTASNSLGLVEPRIAAEWHPTRNADVTPADVVAGSERTVWWKCPAGHDHEWQARVVNRTRAGTGCPFCSGAKACSMNSLAALAPHLVEEWDTARNEGLGADEIVAGSGQKRWWRCSKGHRWRTEVRNRVAGKGGCPQCG